MVVSIEESAKKSLQPMFQPPRAKTRVTDPMKLGSFVVALGLFWALRDLPTWFDPVVAKYALSLGLSFAALNPLAPVLETIITFSWWYFLAIFLVINAYQVTWAGIRYRMRSANRKHSAPEDRFLPSVAVLIPAHNEEKHLGATLESVLTQSYPNISQIIVVDDGSSDGTREVVEGYAARDRRVVYRQHRTNVGKPDALNTGFSTSNCDLTFFMDGDSYLEWDAIERLVRHFKDPQMGAVASLIAIHNNGSLIGKCQEIEFFFTQLVTRFCQSLEKTVLICPGAGTMVRTEIAKAMHHESRTITEDADFTFQLQRNWRIGQEPDAISYTDAMDTRRSFDNQRIRWLYGVLQTLSLHKWSLRKLWVLWAWLGYITCPILLAIMAAVPFMVAVFGYGFLAYYVAYSLLIGAIVWAFHAAPILWHPHPDKKLVLFIPIYMAYQQYLNLIQFYCLLAKAFRLGVRIRYGPRSIRAF